MSASAEAHYCLPQDCRPADVEAALGALGHVDFASLRREQLDVVDNFPGDIWADGGLLTRTRSGELCWWHEGRCALSLQAPSEARFWWEVPASPLREQLQRCIGLWSLMTRASVGLARKPLVLRNRDDKIVVRGEWCELAQMQTRFRVTALRGYAAEFARACEALERIGGTLVEPLDLRQWLGTSGLVPQGLELKGPYGIEAGEPAGAAVRRMARSMFELARRFEGGVIDDTDSEFVHQYRVSLRKLRSLLTLMKNTLPPDLPARAKGELARMAGAMGTLRDLDVFLLDQERYRQMLPGPFQPGFDALIAQVRRDRQRALSATRRQLRSTAYARRCDQLLQLLDAQPEYAAEAADKAVGRVASARILKRYKRIRAASLRVDASTPDAQIHAIRIECKKLRYMLEFFAELYPRSRLKTLSRALKRLQDVLGRFNDVSVQQGFLAAYAGRSQDDAQRAAIHGLIAVLHQDQLGLRDQAETELQQFAQDHVAANFSAMFGRNGA